MTCFLRFLLGIFALSVACPITAKETDSSVSREAKVGGVRYVLLSVSRETILTGEKEPAKAFRKQLRITFLVERLEAPKKAEKLHLGETQVFLAGTNKRADRDVNHVIVRGYPLDKYPSPDRVQLPQLQHKEWASIYELDLFPLKKIEGGKIDIRVKGIGVEGQIGNCEFRKLPLD